MKPLLSPQAVYVTDSVESDPHSRQRAERIIAAMQPDHVNRNVDDAQLNAVVEERGWNRGTKWGQTEEKRDPDVVFTKFRADLSKEEKQQRLEQFPRLGTSLLSAHDALIFRVDGVPEWRKEHRRVCQPAWQLHTVTGCSFRCHYCWFGHVINLRVNIEEILNHVDERIAHLRPRQTIWKWDNQTDINCFEPEYDATRPVIEYFAQHDDHYLLLYTGKSDNVDFMLDLDHKGRTIVQWSLSPRTQAEVFEPLTAAWDERVESARKCEEAGYQVRFRFSPIMPVRNWKQEYTELIELIFARTHPDILSLCMFGWMDFEQAEQCLDLSLWDPDYVEAMRGCAPFLTGWRYGPLPHEARAAIYRYLIDEIRRVSPETTIALCLETPEMWRVFQDDLQQTDENYACVCGPTCNPGGSLGLAGQDQEMTGCEM